MTSSNFTTSAQYYKFRTPYSKGFFKQLAERLPCTSTSSILDIACGNGALAIGLIPFVRDITAIDFSEGMLSVAPRHQKITYLHRDMNEAPLTGPRVDHVVIGRAIHWLKPDTLAGTLTNVLNRCGRVAICASDFEPDVPWRADFRALRRSYGGSPKEDRREQREAVVSAIGLRPVDRVSHTLVARMKPDYLIGHALSYSLNTQAILADMATFNQKLAKIITPYLKDGHVEAPIVSWAILYARDSTAVG